MTMRDLGRKGGLRGGPTRARKLSKRRKVEILVLEQPRNAEELRWFIAQYGNGRAHAGGGDPVAAFLDTLTACRTDAGLARMLPVFLHRARAEIFAEPNRLLAVSAENACVLGYFLEITAKLSNVDCPTGLLEALRRKSRTVKKPVVLFRRQLAAVRTSSLADSWQLVVGEPDESFESYFAKMLKPQQVAFRRMPSLGKQLDAFRAR